MLACYSISPNIREGLLEAFYGIYEKDPDKVIILLSKVACCRARFLNCHSCNNNVNNIVVGLVVCESDLVTIDMSVLCRSFKQ